MSQIKLKGATSGDITIDVPAVAGTNTLTLPASTGTVLTDTAPKTGNILQVVQGRTKTLVTTTSPTYVGIGLEATITPSSTSSKILVISNVAGIMVGATVNSYCALSLFRDSTNVTEDLAAPYLAYPCGFLSVAEARATSSAINYLDSPASTSALTYKIQTAITGGATVNVQRDGQVYSTIILMEVAG